MSFLDRFRKKKDEREELSERFRQMLQVRYPAATMKPLGGFSYRIEGGGVKEITITLENLLRQTQGMDATAAEAFTQRWFFAMVHASDAADEVFPEQIVPMIKDQLYLNEASKVPIIKEHLAADLWIIYAIDYPTRMGTLSPDNLTKLGLVEEELRPLAIANLRKLLPSVEKIGEGEWFAVSASDYTASLLLFDELWAELAGHIQGDVIVVVPVRDLILVTGSESATGIAAIRAKAAEIEQGGSYAISQTLLRRRDNGWIAFS